MKTIPKGAYPAMLTPFTVTGEVDYPALKRLIKWYEDKNCPGILALCASSEINQLTLEERVEIARFIMKHRTTMTVVASGHVSDSFDDQIEELNAVVETGVDGLCMIVDRLNLKRETEDGYIDNIKTVMSELDNKEIPLGFYERPSEFNRSLSEKILQFCAGTGRFVFLKETSCKKAVIAEKIKAVEGSNFGIYNANSSLLYESLKDGAAGFCGIMGNFHPDLYQWLCENYDKHPAEAARLSDYLGVLGEITNQYPAIAKYHINAYGAEMTTYVRRTGLAPLSEEHTYRIHQAERIVSELRDWLATVK